MRPLTSKTLGPASHRPCMSSRGLCFQRNFGGDGCGTVGFTGVGVLVRTVVTVGLGVGTTTDVTVGVEDAAGWGVALGTCVETLAVNRARTVDTARVSMSRGFKVGAGSGAGVIRPHVVETKTRTSPSIMCQPLCTILTLGISNSLLHTEV